MFGGVLSVKLGGYKSIKSPKIVGLLAFLSLIPNILIASTKSLAILGIFLFLYFFLVSATLQITDGWSSESLPKGNAEAGSKIKTLSFNLFGDIFGVIYYGLVFNQSYANNPTLAWKVVMLFYFVGIIIIGFSCYLNHKRMKNAERNELGKFGALLYPDKSERNENGASNIENELEDDEPGLLELKC